MTTASGRTPATILIVPCYNEERRLDLAAVRAFLAAQEDIDLVFVNDGSRDRTLDKLAELCVGFESRASILDLPANVGKAEAVRAGLRRALTLGPRFVGFWDADLATPLPVAVDFIELLERRQDIEWVFGARVKLLGRNIARQPIRHYFGRVFASAVSLALGVGVYDTQCGAKIFRATSEFGQLLQDPFLTRWIFDVELMARLVYARRDTGRPLLEEMVYEFPLLEWHDVAGSKVKSTDFIVAAGELWQIRRRYLTGSVRRRHAAQLPAGSPARTI